MHRTRTRTRMADIQKQRRVLDSPCAIFDGHRCEYFELHWQEQTTS